MKTKILPVTICLICIFFSTYGQTSWKGVTSTNWATATNWTGGVPVAATDAIIGDANFTGAFQPAISSTATAKSLTIGGAVTSQLTVSSTLTVNGNINITSNGTLINGSASISLTGNWNNSGAYTTSSGNALVTFTGITQSCNGSSVTTFRKLTVNTGSTVTLNANLISAGLSSIVTINGTLDPNESPTYLLTSENLTVNNNAVLKIKGGTFADNYIVSASFLLNAGSIVDYSAATANQTISSAYAYSTIKINGSGIRSLSADLPLLRSSSSTTGYIYVLSGTLNLSSYIANRGTTVAGGSISVSNGAFLNIGGAGTFPAGYGAYTLGLTATVEYNGANQSVAAKTYGNLVLSSSGGAVVKTMPATAFTVAGAFTSTIGSGTAVAYTAAANITVTGTFNIGASTTFSGATFTHSISGNFNNNGTFVQGTSTIGLKGTGTVISGNVVQNFHNLTITAPNVTAPAITNINIAGNLATTGSGAFTQPLPGILTMTGTTKTITGTNIVFNDLIITGVVTTTSTATVKGDLNVSGSLSASAGIITLSGAGKIISNSGTLNLYGLLISGSITTATNFNISSSLNTSGTFSASAGTATFTGSSLLSGTAGLFNVTINGTSLSLASNSVLGIANVFTVTAGSLKVTTYLPNTVNYNGAGAQTIKGTTYNNLTLSNGNTKTAGAAITVNNALTIAASTTFAAASFTHIILGNWINTGTFTAGTSSIQFTGATNASISGISTFNNLTISKTLTSYSVTLLNNISVSTITMTLGSLYTGNNTLTITTTRTGNGIIIGTITRTHAFVAAVSYAFEGPNNTILFAAGVSGVTSITVNVTVASVVDFPFGGAIGRYYTITVPSGTYNATLRLHYEDVELNGNTESIMQLWKYNGSAWTVSGKTGNSTTSNYIEKSGLTDITNRWSCTDDGSVLQWTGSVSTDWSNGSNWSLVQGTFSGAPTFNDIAEIGTATFTNQPIITNTANAKSIIFGSTQAASLTLNTGGSLNAGNITGTWSGNAIHTINANAQTITVNGDLVLSDNTSNHAINLNITTGTVTISGSLIESGNANITFTGAGTLNIGNDFIYSSGTFTPATGLVKYTGTVSQMVGEVPYNNLTIIKSAGTIATLNNPSSIAGSLIVTSGEFDTKNTLTIAGAVTVSAGAILDANAALINAGGNWTIVATGIFNAGNGTVNFNGTGTQTISAGAFNILSFNKPAGTAVLSGNNTVGGDLSLLTGTLNLSTFTLNQSSAGDIFTIADGTTLLVSGTNNFPTNFTSYNIGTNSLVNYNGTIAQNIQDLTYGNIVFSNGGALEKVFLGSSIINGNLTISSGASMNASVYTITLMGDWNNAGNFIDSTSTIVLSGGATGANKSLSGSSTFYNFIITGFYAVTPGSNFIFIGDLELTGFIDWGFSNKSFYGNVTMSGVGSDDGISTLMGTKVQYLLYTGTFLSPNYSSSVIFQGTIAPVSHATTSATFINLEISNTDPLGIVSDADIIVLGTFLVSPGCTWNGVNQHHTFMGPFVNNGTVLSTGTLTFAQGPPLNLAPSTTIHIGSGSGFQSTGTVEFGGQSELIIDGVPTSFNNVIISNTNSAGISPVSDWNMTGNFSVNSNAIFNAGNYSYLVGGNIESDGMLNGNTSTFTMSSASGLISGSPATVFHNFTITGSVTSSSDFYVDADFTDNGTYDGSNGALIMTGNNPSVIGGSTSPSAIAQLTISKTGGAVVTTNVTINSLSALIINSGTLFISTYSLFQNAGGGALIIYPGATLKLGGTNTLPAFSGYGLDVQSTVDYAGTTQTIANGAVYGNLTLSAAGNKSVTSFLPLTIAGNFTLSAGNFIANNNTHKIQGNWIMTGGTFNNTNSVIRFDGIADQDIQTIAPFNSVNVNKNSGDVTLSSDITVNAILSFTLGKIKTGSQAVIIPSTGSVTGAAQNTGWVNGNLQKNVATGTNVSRTFEIGDSSFYSRAIVLFANVSTTGNLRANARGTEHPQIDYSGINTNRDVNRYWTLTNSGIVFTTAASTFHWVATDVDAGAATSNFRTGVFNGSSWSFSTYASPLATSIQATGLTSFGSFAIGEKATLSAWTGAGGTSDWFTPANWRGGVPDATMQTLIPTTLQPGNVFPIINTGIAVVDTITIQSAASLIVTNSILQIKGAIINSGVFDVSNGTIVMNGTVSQTIPANAFANNSIFNLNISNNVTLGGTGAVTGILSFGNVNNKTFTTGGNLILRSTASRTASVADITNNNANTGNTISGNVMVERYLSSLNNRAYRLLAPAVNTATNIHANWQEGAGSNVHNPTPGYGTHITGAITDQTNGFDGSTSGQGSLFTYNQATAGWVAAANTNSTLLNAQAGYLIYIRGDRTIDLYSQSNPLPTTNTTLRATGTLLTGTQTFSGLADNNKFSLITNPFASAINWATVQAASTGITNSYTLWDPNFGTRGGYVTVNTSGVASSGLATQNIQSGQAFLVQASGVSSPTVIVREIDKSSANNIDVFSPVSALQTFSTSLYFNLPNGTRRIADGTINIFNNNYSASVDGNDAEEINNWDENIAINRNGKHLGIESRPVIAVNDTIPLFINHLKQQAYQFEFVAANLYQQGLGGYLKDNFVPLNSIPINLNDTTRINFTVTADPLSYAADRFQIVFNSLAPLPVTLTNLKAYKQAANIVVEWKVENELNMKQYGVERSADGISFITMSVIAATGAAAYTWIDIDPVTGNNFYRIKSIDTDGHSKYSSVVKISGARVKQSITIQPNPIQDGIVSLSFENMSKGIYYLKVIDQLGQVVIKSSINHNEGSSIEMILLNKDISAGIYLLEIIKPDNSIVTNKMYVR